MTVQECDEHIATLTQAVANLEARENHSPTSLAALKFRKLALERVTERRKELKQCE